MYFYVEHVLHNSLANMADKILQVVIAPLSADVYDALREGESLAS
jgi:hypothetical protein